MYICVCMYIYIAVIYIYVHIAVIYMCVYILLFMCLCVCVCIAARLQAQAAASIADLSSLQTAQKGVVVIGPSFNKGSGLAGLYLGGNAANTTLPSFQVNRQSSSEV